MGSFDVGLCGMKQEVVSVALYNVYNIFLDLSIKHVRKMCLSRRPDELCSYGSVVWHTDVAWPP